MNNSTSLKTNSYQVVALGFWLPCGRGNFYRDSDDGELFTKPDKKELVDNYRENIKDKKSIQSSLINRFIKVFSKISKGVIIPIMPSGRKGKLNSDPEGIVTSFSISDEDIKKIVVISNEKGFNILLALVSSAQTEQIIEDRLTSIITKKFCGTKDITISTMKENFKEDDRQKRQPKNYNYDGVLPFFQLNQIAEGLFNPDFDPIKFFDSSLNKTKLKIIDEEYTLVKFLKKIISVPIIVDQLKIDHSEVICFLNNEYGDNDQKKLRKDTVSMYDCIFEKGEITTEILRQFLKNISADCLLDLKWDIESCRRNLLNIMLNSVHKQDKLNQLESRDRDATDSYMGGSNEAQLRGYAMFISAKLPLILNVNRHVFTVYNSYCSLDVKEEIRSLFNDWNGLVEAIDENISRLDRAIEQSRMDTLLLEQQQIRAEQETMAEIERVRERNGNNGSGGDGGSSAIGLNNNHIAMMALLLAIIIFPKITIKNGNDLVAEEIYIVFFKYLFENGKIFSIIEKYLSDFLYFFAPCLILIFVLVLVMSRIFNPDSTKKCLNYLYKWCEIKLYLFIYFFVKERRVSRSNLIDISKDIREWFAGIFDLFYTSIIHRQLPLILRTAMLNVDSDLKTIKLLFKEEVIKGRKSKIKHVYEILIFLSSIEVTLFLEHFWRINNSLNESFALIQITILVTIFLAIFWIGKLLEAYERHKKDDEIEKKAKFYYEMDVRIQLPIDKDYVDKLTSDNPTYTSSKINENKRNEKIKMNRDSYKAEYFSGTEIHHKIYFEAPSGYQLI